LENELLSTLRIVLVAWALVLGCYASASAIAELGSLNRPAFPSEPAKVTSLSSGEVPGWLAAVSPFRSDLEADNALIAALGTIKSAKQRPATGSPAENDRTRARVRQTLSIAPYDAQLRLALAPLQALSDPHDPTPAEALKMFYFTAPNDVRLMPVRLDIATLFDALSHPDVKELARGDITRQPELMAAVASAYRRASSLGKAFLLEAVQSIDPSFLPTCAP
jgi:hypothetical protein